MRVLVLSPLVPSETGSGFQIRVHHLYRRLVELGHEVTVCCPIPADQQARAATERAFGIAVRGAERPASRVRETVGALRERPGLLGLALRRPLTAWQLEVLWRAMGPAVSDAIAQRPDVVLVEWDTAAAWVAHLPPDLPAVLAAADASWSYLERRAQQASGARRWWLRLESARTRRFVRMWLPRFAEIVAVSDTDRDRAAALAPGLQIAVVDNGVDLDAFRPAPESVAAPAVLFTGTLNYAPNADAALWLVQDIWPGVRERLPDARLIIAGRNPPAAVRALSELAGVEVRADVPDMRPLFVEAHVVVAPIRSGGGTRLKILEAAAAGRAVVSTSTGAEGLRLRDGRDLVLADTPAAFADAVCELLADAERRTQLARSARRVVETEYGWPALGDRLDVVLRRAVRGSSAGRSASGHRRR